MGLCCRVIEFGMREGTLVTSWAFVVPGVLHSQSVPRYCGSSLSRDVYRNIVIGDLSDPDGGSIVCVRNKSPAGQESIRIAIAPG
jgi:hypothetical protein